MLTKGFLDVLLHFLKTKELTKGQLFTVYFKFGFNQWTYITCFTASITFLGLGNQASMSVGA